MAPNSSNRGKEEFVVVFAMVVILGMIWSPVLSNGFVTNWDDQWMVLENPYLAEVSIQNMLAIFTESYGSQYSPLNTMAFLGLMQTSGGNAFPFHLYSLLFHLANFILVGLVLKKLLVMIQGVQLNEPAVTGIAWATAFLFAIHPLQVESVAWISASKIVLYSFFYLLGLWFYLLYKESGKRFHLVLVLLCFVASLLSKEQAVVFVATLIVTDLVIHKDLKQKRIWLEKVPFVIVGLLFGIFTLSIQGGSGVGGSYPFGQRLLFGNYSYWEYLIKLATPHNLTHFYFYPMDPGMSIPVRFWFYPLATGLLVWGLYEYRNRINKVYLFGGLFFLINMALVLHVIPAPRGAIIADRYVYLSVIGFFLIFVYMVSPLILNRNGFVKKSLLTIAAVWLLVLAGTTHQRAKAWENMDTLNEGVRDVVERNTGEFNLYEEE